MNSYLAKTAPGVESRYPQLLFLVPHVLILGIVFESVPLPVQAQITPLTSLLSLALLPILYISVNKTHLTPLFKFVALLTLFTILHSILALLVDITLLGSSGSRFYAWGRQIIAFTAGISVFFVLRMLLLNFNDRYVLTLVLVGSLPALFLSLLNVLWGTLGNDTVGDFIIVVREHLVPLGYTAASRSSGILLEPSHFAFYIVTMLFPSLLAVAYRRWRNIHWLLLGLAIFISFVWTKSATGLLTFGGLVLAGVLFGPRRSYFVSATVLGSLSVGLILVLFPQNYLSYQLHQLISGNWTVSVVTRFYSAFGPFLTVESNPSILFGYGLGGTSAHFDVVMPDTAQSIIAEVSWEGMVNLKSLVGRIFTETGIGGLLLFGGTIATALRETSVVASQSVSVERTTFVKFARLGIAATVFGSTIGFGSFALPYLWFWLAYIDSRYILESEVA